jgi:hypothetical protein
MNRFGYEEFTDRPGAFACHFADDVDRLQVLDEILRDGINAHRPDAGIGIERVGAAAEALVHRDPRRSLRARFRR